MAAQLNYSSEELNNEPTTANIPYVDDDELKEITLIAKQGLTMPTTGGGAPWQQ